MIARSIRDLLQEKKVFPAGVWASPEVSREEGVLLTPHFEQWNGLRQAQISLSPSDLADIVRVATIGRRVDTMSVQEKMTDIVINYPQGSIVTTEDIASLPIGVGSKIIPLKALATVSREEIDPVIYQENGRQLFLLQGRVGQNAEVDASRALTQAKSIVNDWKKGHDTGISTVTFADAKYELTQALSQLSWAVLFSIALIFLTLLLQFGQIAPALIVLVSVPLGFVGVILCLFIFQSTLSLKSALGVILLNGIAIAISILLVDFIQTLVKRGLSPHEATIEASKKRKNNSHKAQGNRDQNN